MTKLSPLFPALIAFVFFALLVGGLVLAGKIGEGNGMLLLGPIGLVVATLGSTLAGHGAGSSAALAGVASGSAPAAAPPALPAAPAVVKAAGALVLLGALGRALPACSSAPLSPTTETAVDSGLGIGGTLACDVIGAVVSGVPISACSTWATLVEQAVAQAVADLGAQAAPPAMTAEVKMAPLTVNGGVVALVPASIAVRAQAHLSAPAGGSASKALDGGSRK